jgi:dihydrofolate reductase
MRKIILLMHVSLDGFVCGPNGEMDWIGLDNTMWDDVKRITDSSDTALYGAVTFRMMEAYWPTAADKPNADKHDIDHSQWVNNVQKIVFSTNDLKTDWQNTRVIHTNVMEEMNAIKAVAGKNLLMLGSPTLAHSFMDLGLIDEFWLNINPVVIGSGKPLFLNVKKKMNLKLVEEKTYVNGVVGLHYEVVR